METHNVIRIGPLSRVKQLYGNKELNEIEMKLLFDEKTIMYLVEQAMVFYDGDVSRAIQVSCYVAAVNNEK